MHAYKQYLPAFADNMHIHIFMHFLIWDYTMRHTFNLLNFFCQNGRHYWRHSHLYSLSTRLMITSSRAHEFYLLPADANYRRAHFEEILPLGGQMIFAYEATMLSRAFDGPPLIAADDMRRAMRRFDAASALFISAMPLISFQQQRAAAGPEASLMSYVLRLSRIMRDYDGGSPAFDARFRLPPVALAFGMPIFAQHGRADFIYCVDD